MRGLRLASGLERHGGRFLLALAVVTALLAIPFLALAPTESASTEPTGDVFTARDRVDDAFVSAVHPTILIAEADGGDVLRAEPLQRLLEMNDQLRADPDLGPTLLSYYEIDAGRDVTGMLTLAELVDAELERDRTSLATATDEEVKAAGAALIDRHGVRSDLLGLSAQSRLDESGRWVVPAVQVLVLSDNEVLGFGNTAVNLGGDTDVEEFDRQIQANYRQDGWTAHGVAIDVNLTSQEQGAVAGPFIGFTIVAVLVLVGLTFRSYWVMAVVSVAFLALIVWLKGISNLIGLKDDLVLSLIVPVAMISFGVDFAFHALGRYREERAEGHDAAAAFVVGSAGVGSALLLALASDTTAFLSNLTSGIESIIQFGLGAAIALASAYLLLGLATPLTVARIEQMVPEPSAGRTSTLLRLTAGIGAAGLTMASVLLLVFVLPWLGLVLAAFTSVVALAVPVAVRRRAAGVRVGDGLVEADASRAPAAIGRAVTALARRPQVVLPTAVLLTVGAGVFAVQVPAQFDVEDFFASDTDFVVGLDQLDTHVGDRGGEPARLYVEADLSDPAQLAAIDRSLDRIRQLPDAPLARDEAGEVLIEGGVFEVFDAAWDSPVMPGLVEVQTGVSLTDANGDSIPDTTAQVQALVSVASEIGVPLDRTNLALTPDNVRTSVVLGVDGAPGQTVFDMQVPNSRVQEVVTDARDTLDPIAAELSEDLGGSFVQITGSAFVREASLSATNRALQVSLPVALLACLAISTIFLRSIRYGIASIVPIVMVVAWLYGFMYLGGYAINLVTATIAAVSIGIGIDFAIHFIARFREELARRGEPLDAVHVTGEGTGLALVASAVSSAVGFGILAFAPMPLFAAYGLLTALMIGLALVATLAVLPSVLVILSGRR